MAGLQEQIDDLVRQVAFNRTEIDALERRAGESEARADAAERQSDIDREMIAELQRDGVLSRKHAAQMEAALKSSRIVGAATGILMRSRNLNESEAFEILRKVSQNSNRKIRDLATELVHSANDGDPSSVNELN